MANLFCYVLRVAVAFGFCATATTALARVDILPSSAPDQVLVWDLSDVVVIQDFCVMSTQSPQDTSTDVIPYSVELAGPIELEEQGGGSGTIAATARWVDLETGNVTTLDPDSPTAPIMTGTTLNCPGGDNGRLILRYPNLSIHAAPPGIYRQRYAVSVTNSGAGKSASTGRMNVQLDVPDSIRISEIDDIDLGTYAGTDMVGSDMLCVFRASGLGYGVTVTGSGSGGAFMLSDGTTEIPFSASWDDGSGASPLTPGSLLAGQINAATGAESCNNGATNNAELAVVISAADLIADGVRAGDYSGTLTITVEME